MDQAGNAGRPATAGQDHRVDLVIFDCDGVLVDSERLAVEVDRRIFADLGWDLSPEEIVERFVGRSEPDNRRQVEAHLGRSLGPDWQAPYQGWWDEAGAALQPIPGVGEVLEGLALPRCVGSSSSHAAIRRKLERTGLLRHFGDRIFSSQDVAQGKPAPDLFLHAAASMGADPGRCVVVEDSVHGIAAGQAAGMRVLAFSGSVTPRARLEATGAEVFDAMADLPALLAGPPRLP